jgi:hypothetical protein
MYFNNADQIIFWAKEGGLANRLRALVGYQAMATIFGIPFTLIWEKNPSCDTYFDSIFSDYDFVLIQDIDKHPLISNTGNCTFTDVPYYSSIWEKHVRAFCSWEEYRSLAVMNLRQMKPVPSIQDKIDSFLEAKTIHTRVGIHVRMTDNVQAYSWWRNNATGFDMQKISTRESFYTFIRSEIDRDPNVSFFLATDKLV